MIVGGLGRCGIASASVVCNNDLGALIVVVDSLNAGENTASDNFKSSKIQSACLPAHVILRLAVLLRLYCPLYYKSPNPTSPLLLSQIQLAATNVHLK